MSKYRILADNISKQGIITATNQDAAFPTTNLTSGRKSLVWRSNASTSNLTTVFTNTKKVSCIVLFCTNLVASDISGVSVSGIPVGDTSIRSTAYRPQDRGIYTYSEGETNYLTIYLPEQVLTNFTIHITKAGGIIEVSKLLCGSYWSSRFNFDKNQALDIIDSSSLSRSIAGNTLVDVGTVHKQIQFDIGYLEDAEKLSLYSMLTRVGTSNPIFVSLFPEDEDAEKEEMYSIYGTLTNIPIFTQQLLQIASTSISIEEV